MEQNSSSAEIRTPTSKGIGAYILHLTPLSHITKLTGKVRL